MNSPSKDIKDILDGESGLALIFGTNLFVSETPGSPSFCVTIYDSGGGDPSPSITYEQPNVQVQVRGNRGGYEEAHELGQAIRDTLNGLSNYTINDARYIGIWAVGDIFFTGHDDNQRPLLTVNFRLHRTNA